MELKKRIFVVEDESGVLDYLGAIISSAGYEFISCRNGGEAFSRIQNEFPDLIVLDVMLPELDGISLCKKIKSNKKTHSIPVIMVTALTDGSTIQDAYVSGARDCLPKPLDREIFKNKIHNALQESVPSLALN